MPSFLTLPPQQGGTRFGPFPAGIVQLGTEANHCQLVLSPMPGIAPVHASITSMGGGRFTVQPTQQGLTLFLVQRGQTHMWPVEAPVTASVGDKVILGSAEGPCFELGWEEAPAAASAMPMASGPTGATAARPRGPAMPSASGMATGVAGEIQRQAFARMLGKAGPMRDLYHMYYRYKSGALQNPRVMLSILGTVVGGLAVMATGCAGLVSALIFGG